MVIALVTIAIAANAQVHISVGPGIGINYAAYSFSDVDETYGDIAPLITSQVDMQFSRLLSLLLWVDFYNDMSVKEVKGDDYGDYKISYLSLAPTLKFCFPGSAFYIYGGPGFGFKTKGNILFSYSGRAMESDISDMNVRIDARLGLGYDFFLSQKLTLSPFAGFNFALNDVYKDSDWKINVMQAGIVLRFNAF